MTTFTPGPPSPPSNPLALNEAKTLSPLISSAWRLWSSQPGVFLMTAALVVIPVQVIIGGVIGHGFLDPYGKVDAIPGGVQTVFMSTVGTSLVTATHARSVVALAQGEALTTERAFKLGVAVLGSVLLAALVYFVAVVIGVLGLIVGAVIVSIYGIFCTQVAAIEGLGPIDSLKASFTLVKANGWWRTFGYQFVLGLIVGVLGLLVSLVIALVSSGLGEPSSFGIPATLLLALTQTVFLSWSALVTTLLYFSWRAGAERPFGSAEASSMGGPIGYEGSAGS